MLIINSPETYYKRYYVYGGLYKTIINLNKALNSIKNNGLTYTLNKIKEKVFLK